MLKIVSIAVAATLLTAAHAPAAEPIQVRVVYEDLDLATAQGIHELESRIDRAVDAACPEPPGLRVMKFEQDWRECRRIARAAAAEQVAAVLRDQRVQVADAGRAGGD